MKFRFIWDGFTDAHGDDALSSTKRIVITNNVLNNTRKKSTDDQKALVGDLGCRLPRTLEAAALCTTTFIATGKRLYNDSPNTYTRCEENVQGRQMFVGGLSAAGLRVDPPPLGLRLLRRRGGFGSPLNFGAWCLEHWRLALVLVSWKLGRCGWLEASRRFFVCLQKVMVSQA